MEPLEAWVCRRLPCTQPAGTNVYVRACAPVQGRDGAGEGSGPAHLGPDELCQDVWTLSLSRGSAVTDNHISHAKDLVVTLPRQELGMTGALQPSAQEMHWFGSPRWVPCAPASSWVGITGRG